MKKITNIRYTSRDFDSIKSDLVEYAKRYFPNTYRDFNEASFGALMIDSLSYIGDILSFYIDYQANESFLENAIEYQNILKLGKARGYKLKLNPSSYGILTFYVLIPAQNIGLGPNSSYLPVLRKGSRFNSSNGNLFTLIEDVDFSKSTNEVVVAQVNDSTQMPTYYAVKAKGMAVSGKIEEQYFTVGEYERFRRLTINDPTFAEVISIFDAEGNEYFEVEHLSQNIIYKAVYVEGSSENDSLTYMKPIVASHRFTVERDLENIYVQFGYGSEENLTVDNVENPLGIILNVHGRNYVSDTSFDPTKLIMTDKFGVAPSNTILKVTYRTNVSDSVNAASYTINGVSRGTLSFENENLLNSSIVASIKNSLEVINESPFVGDISMPDSEELKRNIGDTFATQKRAVTFEDYKALTYNLPSQFGAIKRCNIVVDRAVNKRNLNLYVVSSDENEQLISTGDVIKQNLKTHLNRYRMINDTIDILDAKIVNLGIDFVALGDSISDKFSILSNATDTLISFFKNLPDIGEPFWITDVYKVLNDLEKIIDVVDVKVSLKTGTGYSSTYFSIDDVLSADGRYILIPKNVIWEIKFPKSDIRGTIR